MSNFVGFMLDSALELGVKKLIIGGHPGKLAKIAAGVMQTHSKYAEDVYKRQIQCGLL